MRSYLIILLLLSPLGGVAQAYLSSSLSVTSPLPKSHYFEHLSVKDGLSNNSINCILQDREGFIWFGTSDGLNKYDGYTFTAFQADLTNPERSLQHNQISGLCEDRQNRLWAVTEGGGLHEINKKTGQITPHPIRTSNASRWNFQHSIYEDRQGVLWLGTFGGLARYEPATHHFTLYPSPQPNLPIKTVFEDRQNRFWIATLRGLYQFDQKTGQFVSIPASVPAGPQPAFISFFLDNQNVLWLGTAGHGLFQIDLNHEPFQPVPYNPGNQINPYVYLNSIHQDAAGIIWVGTTNGLQCIDPVHQQIYTYHPDPNNPKGISSNYAQAVYFDRAGTLWVGTNNGIDHQATHSKPFLSYQVTPNASAVNLTENKVRSLLVDSLNRLWCNNEWTIYRVDLRTNRMENRPPEQTGGNGQVKNYIHRILPNGSKGMWVGTWNSLYHLDYASDQYTQYPSDSVRVEFLSQRKNGPVWIGGEGGIASFDIHTHRYTYYTYKQGDTTGLPDRYLSGIMVSRTGDVWVLVQRHGICRLNPITGRFTRYTAGQEGRLNTNEVRTIYEDDNGIIWIGTHQGGLNRFDPQTEKFSSITTRDGLPSNSIAAITVDGNGNIWLSTNKGICRFNPRTKSICNYGTNDGLTSNTFLEDAVFRHNNRIFFGSLNGVAYFNPAQISSDKRPFPVHITGFKVMDQSRPLTDSELVLKHDENFLSFEFAALTYVLPEQNQYTYQLVGVDKQWVKSGNRRFVTYPNLVPGQYTFRVKASNSDGIWSRKEAVTRFIIQPPWWATWWAYSIYALLVVSSIAGYIRFYTNRIRQQQKAEQLKAVEELKNRFFSNITHEFRTPLSLIIAPVEKMLQENKVDQPTRQTLGTIQRNAGQLLRLINQLLDLSKLEANSMGISLMQGDIIEFAEEIVESVQQMAEQKGVLVSYEADKSMPECLFDADKWGKILTNLLTNSVKFTGSGGQVTVALNPIRLGADETVSSVHIAVEDTGIGIAPEKLPYIFDRFYQVDDSRTRSYEGTGIGLALVKELVDLLGGTIAVTSELNKGTQFLLEIPIQPILEAQVDMPKASFSYDEQIAIDYSLERTEVIPALLQVDNHQEKPLILIVEDNRDLREFLLSELAESYQILSAANGEQGWLLVQEELPDIVISDLMMPRMDGYELTERIKNHPATNHIAVMLLTAKSAQDNRLEGLKKGADEYLTKPFSVEEIHLRLRNLLAHQQKLRQYYAQQLSHPNAPISTEIAQDPFLQQLYELLDKNLSNPELNINVDWLANQLSMVRKTLNRKVHSLTRLTPLELIRRYRFRKAAELLLAGNTVTETSEIVGFKALAHFTKSFRDFYHQTPTEFIENRKVRG